MTSAVTAPLERQFGQLANLNQMTSQSSAGASVITLQFNLDLGIDIATRRSRPRSTPPATCCRRPAGASVYAKVNPADAPILTLALTSKTLALTQVRDLAETRLAQKISQVSGVGLVSMAGGMRPAVRVRFNASALAAYGLNIDDLRTTINNLNVNTPKGSIDGPTQSFTINANDQIRDPNAYRDAVIAYRNGAPVRLSAVAEVVEGAENTQLGAWMDTTPAVILNIQRQPGANVIAVVDGPDQGAAAPAPGDAAGGDPGHPAHRPHGDDPRLGRGRAVRAAARHRARGAGDLPVPALAARHPDPEPVGAALARRRALGDGPVGLLPRQPVLMALTIATGFVVDDAIVVIENIARHVEEGDSRWRRRSRARARSASPSSRSRLAAGGADPAPVHGRGGGAPVPRIRHHARRHHRDLGIVSR